MTSENPKIVITCDHLLKNGPMVEIVEHFSNLFPEAPIYTLAHRPGGVTGPLQHKRVFSTYLSNLVKTVEDLQSYRYLIPSASKKLKIPCSYDWAINITEGLSVGIQHCCQTKQVTYLYGDDFSFAKSYKGIVNKFN